MNLKCSFHFAELRSGSWFKYHRLLLFLLNISRISSVNVFFFFFHLLCALRIIFRDVNYFYIFFTGFTRDGSAKVFTLLCQKWKLAECLNSNLVHNLPGRAIKKEREIYLETYLKVYCISCFYCFASSMISGKLFYFCIFFSLSIAIRKFDPYIAELL